MAEISAYLQDKNNRNHYIFKRSDDPSTFGIQDDMNLLLDRGIIHR